MPALARDWSALGRRVKRGALALFWVAALLAGRPSLAAGLPPPWVELGADGRLDLRVLVAAGAACPTASIEGVEQKMAAQGGADPEFPVTLCRAAAGYAAKRLAIGGVRLPSFAAPQRVVVVGDSGCRLEGRQVQDCNDPAAWPFATIARLAAARHPDLVIDIGDYYYRESACPAGRAGCAGSPHGDGWATWKADFFDPATPLLAAAPWVVARGNHELCSRGGRGWFRLLDPHPGALDCPVRTEPYALHLGGLDLLVFDDADADDTAAPPAKVAAYAAQLAPLLAAAPPHSWLVMHRPAWARIEGPPGIVFALNATMQAALRGHVPPTLDLVLSGHIHDLMSFSFGPARPAQLVVGTGGDTLAPFFGPTPAGTLIDRLPVRGAFALGRMGYLLLERGAGGWDGTFHGPDDAVLARCRLAGRELACS